MTVYNFNLGIGWASSGVEYAQVYRARSFRQLGVGAKFVFTDFISQTNIEEMTKNIGLRDSEVVWLYQFFTDFPIGPTTTTLTELAATFAKPVQKRTEEQGGQQVRFLFAPGEWALAYQKEAGSPIVERVEYVINNKLVRQDFFRTGRWMSEYYAPVNQVATCYLRRFFNQDGTIAFEELRDGVHPQDEAIYRIGGDVFYSKADLIAHFVRCLRLGASDVVIIDRATGQAQEILENRGAAAVGAVVHADHFSAPNTDANHILWNNYYEYLFQHAGDLDFLVTATAAQQQLLQQQLHQYAGLDPRIAVIPVGSLAKLRHPREPRQPFSIVTASRLASEKHLDWLVRAVADVHRELPQVTLTIYGEGAERGPLEKLIKELQAGKYVRLMGHQDLTDVYQHYQVYGSASTSEGFGLTLMEAVGAGLAMVGFNVRYGNQTFIRDGQNGVLLPDPVKQSPDQAVMSLARGLRQLFNQADRKKMSTASYRLAENYLRDRVDASWRELLTEVGNQ